MMRCYDWIHVPESTAPFPSFVLYTKQIMKNPHLHFPSPLMTKPVEKNPKQTIHLVSSTNSPEFTLFSWALAHSSVIGLDAEWKPIRTHQSTFPTVSLLQIACRVTADSESSDRHSYELLVFLLDLLAIPLPSIYDRLRDVFVSPEILKLGFRFKQDLAYLSSTFSSQGCNAGFDRVCVFSFLQRFCNAFCLDVLLCFDWFGL